MPDRQSDSDLHLPAPERLAAAFLAALTEDFAAHGAAAIAFARAKHADAYLRLIAALLPKDTPRRTALDGMSDDALAAAIAEVSHRIRGSEA